MNLLKTVKTHPKVLLYLDKGNEYLAARGTIKLDYDHASIVSERSRYLLEQLGFPSQDAELGDIAGFLHDIGNVANRFDHGRSGALLCYKILSQLEMPLEDIVTVMGAVGNHEETAGHAVHQVAAAVIIADKSDLHRDRVRKKDISQFTGRDRVNYAVQNTWLEVDQIEKKIILKIEINQDICPVMDYFEIFLTKMLMCNRAAEFLSCQFKLIINEEQLL